MRARVPDATSSPLTAAHHRRGRRRRLVLQLGHGVLHGLDLVRQIVVAGGDRGVELSELGEEVQPKPVQLELVARRRQLALDGGAVPGRRPREPGAELAPPAAGRAGSRPRAGRAPRSGACWSWGVAPAAGRLAARSSRLARARRRRRARERGARVCSSSLPNSGPAASLTTRIETRACRYHARVRSSEARTSAGEMLTPVERPGSSAPSVAGCRARPRAGRPVRWRSARGRAERADRSGARSDVPRHR